MLSGRHWNKYNERIMRQKFPVKEVRYRPEDDSVTRLRAILALAKLQRERELARGKG